MRNRFTLLYLQVKSVSQDPIRYILAIYTFDNGVCIYGVDDEVIFIMTIYHYGQNSVTVLAGVGQEII